MHLGLNSAQCDGAAVLQNAVTARMETLSVTEQPLFTARQHLAASKGLCSSFCHRYTAVEVTCWWL